jgi:ABC-type nitrate/sulfonate/bicarbonate transport system substrate-binding protein
MPQPVEHAIEEDTMKLTRRELAKKMIAIAGLPSLVTALSSSKAASQNSLETVRVAYNPGTILRLYAALEGDLFTRQGIRVELIRFESGAAATAAFASGSVDVGFTGIPGFLSSRLAGARTRVFMIENDSGAAEGLIVRPQSGINTVTDLPGKKIGTVIGTTSWMGLISALQGARIDPKQVTVENVPPGAWVPALQRGDVDGLFVWSPILFVLESSGNKIVTTMSKHRRDPLLWQARGEFLEKQPKAARGLVAALSDARKLVDSRDEKFITRMSNETAASRAAVTKTVEAIKLIPLEEQVSEQSPYSLSSSGGLKAELNEWLGLYVEKGIFRQKPDLSDAFDTAPIRAVLQK